MPHPPRFGDAPRRGPPPASAEEVARLTRRVGIASGILVVWALAAALAALARTPLVALAAVPLGILALVGLATMLRTGSPAASAFAAWSATFALAFAVAGHVLYWGGIHLRLFLLASDDGVRWASIAAVLVLVPLYAGMRSRALRLAWEASGSRARGLVALVETLARREPDPLARPAWPRAWAGALARWAEGIALPGIVALDAALHLHRPTDRLHADASLDALADALAAHGANVERRGRELVARFGEGAPVALTTSRTLLPPGPSLEVRGPVDEVRRLRRLLEGRASHALVFSWSAPARRWELRLNALHKDALAADSLEERSLVMEELDRVHRAISERALCGQEASVLLLKERDARALLAHRMLSEPPGNLAQTRVRSQHGALLPDLARVLDAGGLDAVKRVAFVPHWIVPVRSRWGEQEVVVSAATGRVDADESRALKAAMAGRGPSLFLDVGARSTFLPVPPPTGALLREAREAGIEVADGVATGEVAVDVVYVPYLTTPEGYVSGVTGRAAPDLGTAVPVAMP